MDPRAMWTCGPPCSDHKATLSGYARCPIDCGYPRIAARNKEARSVVRFRENRPEDLDRARAAVAAWRDRNPSDTCEELLAAIGHQFHQEYAVVLHAVRFAVDRHRARQVTGIPAEERRP
jgi:hypothetical protein